MINYSIYCFSLLGRTIASLTKYILVMKLANSWLLSQASSVKSQLSSLDQQRCDLNWLCDFPNENNLKAPGDSSPISSTTTQTTSTPSWKPSRKTITGWTGNESADWFTFCVMRAPLLYFKRSWVALSFKVCQWVSESGIGNTCPDLHFVQYIKV